MSDLVWCQQCGRWDEWGHKHRLSVRRRMVSPLTKMLMALIETSAGALERVMEWADKPIREAK
jgi:hypothetical protein